MAVTIHDVAKLAGVNSSTVSRVINGKATITPDTKERVYVAMRKLDYHPNSLARSLASGLSGAIGVVVKVRNTPLATRRTVIRRTMNRAVQSPSA